MLSARKRLIGWSVFRLPESVFGLGAQVLLTMGLQREKAGRGSLAMYTQVRDGSFEVAQSLVEANGG